MSAEFGFEPFVRAHASELLRAAVLLAGSRDAGEELLQDTLTHLYPLWTKVAGAEAPVAYVRRVLVNRFLSERRSPRSKTIPVREIPDRAAAGDLGEKIAIKQGVWQLLGELPERQRAAVVLRFFYDLADAEIANILCCRPATVRSLVSRAMAVMRRGLAPDGVDSKAGA